MVGTARRALRPASRAEVAARQRHHPARRLQPVKRPPRAKSSPSEGLEGHGRCEGRQRAGGATPQTRGGPAKSRLASLPAAEQGEISANREVIVQFGGTSICLTNPAPGAGEATENIFAYDYLYQMDSESENVFDGAALVEGLFDEFNGTISPTARRAPSRRAT